MTPTALLTGCESAAPHLSWHLEPGHRRQHHAIGSDETGERLRVVATGPERFRAIPSREFAAGTGATPGEAIVNAGTVAARLIEVLSDAHAATFGEAPPEWRTYDCADLHTAAKDAPPVVIIHGTASGKSEEPPPKPKKAKRKPKK